MNTAEFDAKLKEFLDAGKDDEARAYILEKYTELPTERQESLAWAFLEEAVDYAAREADVLSSLQESAVAAMDE